MKMDGRYLRYIRRYFTAGCAAIKGGSDVRALLILDLGEAAIRGGNRWLAHDPEKLQTFRTRSCVKSKIMRQIKE